MHYDEHICKCNKEDFSLIQVCCAKSFIIECICPFLHNVENGFLTVFSLTLKYN